MLCNGQIFPVTSLRVWNSTGFSFNTFRTEGVVAGNPVVDVYDVCLRHADALIDEGITPKPLRQSRLTAIKLNRSVARAVTGPLLLSG